MAPVFEALVYTIYFKISGGVGGWKVPQVGVEGDWCELVVGIMLKNHPATTRSGGI